MAMILMRKLSQFLYAILDELRLQSKFILKGLCEGTKLLYRTSFTLTMEGIRSHMRGY